jgi:dihydroxyacetone kinase-like protein
MQAFSNAGGGDIVLAIAQRIVENRAYLSDIDGLIGDGDHGVNMAKGFWLAAERLRGEPQSLTASLATLGDVLMTEIGGSMGPLYGMMFSGFAEALDGVEEIDAAAFERMLRHGLEEVQSIGDAKVGDKTLIDAFAPALQAFSATAAKGGDFAAALDALIVAAEKGRDSTVDLVAKIGRAARLGERSRGVLDPGATSCAIILRSLAEGAKTKLDASNPHTSPHTSSEAQP